MGNGHQEARAAVSLGSGPVRLDGDSGRVREDVRELGSADRPPAPAPAPAPARTGTGTYTAPTRTDERFGKLIGRSPAMQVVFDVLAKASPSDATILLEGETGTGKEVSAEAIHIGSPRKDKPFLVVDCGAMPPQLLESELFGHERGAFTGAVSSRQGVFEAAAGGTVFLDEIGELSIDLQPKLLRVLERREVRRVGTNNHVPINVRLIAATNRGLRDQVGAHKFRSDLYYRLAVVEVKLPPLRERLTDLPLLVEHIVRAFGTVDAATMARIRSPDFLDALARHSWPGNIRELRNYLERCAALRDFTPPRPATGSSPVAPGPESAVNVGQPLREARESWVSAFERRYLEELLRQHDNRVSSAARAAGVDRIYFYRLLWKHGLRTREPSGREPDDLA
ncbi:MAG TPA: sigma-54 dependent transcriptional regulator [Polyangia bacterium]|nr:sigma-54 dependent transcriptional regulator [Polyangia bacterium]